MMRNDINIALVSMVRQKATDNTSIAVNATNLTADSIELPRSSVSDDFDWSTLVQSMILSSFYACYVLSQVIYGLFHLNASKIALQTNLYNQFKSQQIYLKLHTNQ